MIIKILLGILGLMAIGGLLYLLHRWAIVLEDRGYIYYREKPQGGGSNVLFEMDKLTRPSVEHVQQVYDGEHESQENDGD